MYVNAPQSTQIPDDTTINNNKRETESVTESSKKMCLIADRTIDVDMSPSSSEKISSLEQRVCLIDKPL